MIFFLMALLCTGANVDNDVRSSLRSQCRRAASTSEGYLSLVMGNGSSLVTPSMYNATREALGFEPEACGWTALPVRPFPGDGIELDDYQPNGIFRLRTALGGCQEYTDVASGVAWEHSRRPPSRPLRPPKRSIIARQLT